MLQLLEMKWDFSGDSSYMHIHGHSYWVLGTGEGSFDPTTTELNFGNPPTRDNAVVKGDSWSAVRLKAVNTGIWFMHCHIETHVTFGMTTNFVVGTEEE
jgi:laccase